MPTATPRGRTDGVKFALRGVAWSLGLFSVLRLNWTEAHVLLPFTRVQAAAAAALFGTSTVPVAVTLACSGADAIALCLGAILAYPVKWSTRLAGAVAGTVLILLLNLLRISSLGRVAASPARFDLLHVYVWPAVLTVAIAGFVLTWMRLADRRYTLTEDAIAPRERLRDGRPRPSRRFVALTVAFLLLFSLASPLYLQSASVLAVAGFIARVAAVILGSLGMTAHAATNVLWTSHGGFVVTQECIATPLIPVYLAGVCAYSSTWRRLMLGVLATVPLFIALGIGRLLLVALPGSFVAAPLFFVHAFYQLLLGAVVVVVAARWRHAGRAALGHALAGLFAGVLFVGFVGPHYSRLVTDAGGAPLDDPQGAIAFLPAFQVGLFLAVWVAAYIAVGWKRFLTGVAILGLTQTAGLLVLNALASSSSHPVPVSDIRGWAVAGPLLIVATVVHGARPRR